MDAGVWKHPYTVGDDNVMLWLNSCTVKLRFLGILWITVTAPGVVQWRQREQILEGNCLGLCLLITPFSSYSDCVLQ